MRRSSTERPVGIHVDRQSRIVAAEIDISFSSMSKAMGSRIQMRQQQGSHAWNGQPSSHIGGQMRQRPFQQQYVDRQQQQPQPHQPHYVQQQQHHHSSHHVSPKWGIGGPFDCGSNATGWYQRESPPPPNCPMGSVYQCGRCGRIGHKAQICTTPQRFKGTCISCGQYGHRHLNCITYRHQMPWPRQQQQHLMVYDTMTWPQQDVQPLQQQRYHVTPAVTGSREQPPGVSRTFTLLAVERDISRTLARPDAVFCDSEEDYHGGPISEVFGSPESTEEDYHGGPLSEVFGSLESTEEDYHGGPISEVFGSPESTEEDYHGGPLSQVFGSPEWPQTNNAEMSMFPLSEEPPQTEPTAVVFAPRAPAAEAVIGPSIFPAVSSKDMAEAPTLSASAASATVPSVAPATSGTVLPPASVGGASRAPTPSASTALVAVLSAAPATSDTVFPTALLGGAPRATVSSIGPASVESAAGPAISGTVPSAVPVRGAVGGRESFAGAVSSNATAEASLSTGGTAALVESAAWPDRKLASAAESAGDRRVANIFGEKGEPTHPFDPGTVFPLKVRYSTESNSNSSNSTSNSTSNQDPWGDTTSVVELLRPFDPGKGCQRDARRGRAVLGVDLPFDRGKAWRQTKHGG